MNIKQTVTVRIDADDFERLCEDSGNLSQASPALFDRLRDGGRIANFRRGWRHIYWIGDQYANLLLARSFLDTIGEDYQVVVDEGADAVGRPNGWVLLADYASPVWARLAAEEE